MTCEIIVLYAANPTASSATVSLVDGVPDAKTIKAAAKAAKKAQEFNKAFGGDVVV